MKLINKLMKVKTSKLNLAKHFGQSIRDEYLNCEDELNALRQLVDVDVHKFEKHHHNIASLFFYKKHIMVSLANNALSEHIAKYKEFGFCVHADEYECSQFDEAVKKRYGLDIEMRYQFIEESTNNPHYIDLYFVPTSDFQFIAEQVGIRYLKVSFRFKDEHTLPNASYKNVIDFFEESRQVAVVDIAGATNPLALKSSFELLAGFAPLALAPTRIKLAA